jgi:integrase/recombinase XerD
MTTPPATDRRRTPPKRKARQLAKHLRDERPDYAYLKAVFRALRDELDVDVQRQPKTLPYVPSEDEIRRYYQTVWQARRSGDMILIKTLLYTGVRVAELVAIGIDDVDLDACRIRITHGKGGKDRVVPFPQTFRETLALHIADRHKTGGTYLFESSWKKPYSTRGVRALLARYANAAGLRTTCRPTGCGTSCSPGSRPKASTTP